MLCGLCESTYHLDGSHTCLPCEDSGTAAIGLVVVVVLVLLAVAAYLCTRRRKDSIDPEEEARLHQMQQEAQDALLDKVVEGYESDKVKGDEGFADIAEERKGEILKCIADDGQEAADALAELVKGIPQNLLPSLVPYIDVSVVMPSMVKLGINVPDIGILNINALDLTLLICSLEPGILALLMNDMRINAPHLFCQLRTFCVRMLEADLLSR